MLDIKYHFTCGDSDLSEIIKKYQNIMARIAVFNSPPFNKHSQSGHLWYPQKIQQMFNIAPSKIKFSKIAFSKLFFLKTLTL